MRNIALNLEGVTVVARLLEKEAPKTCQALWSNLPFEDMVIHSHFSGARLHTTNHPKLNLDASCYPLVENPSSYQAPGDVVVWPLTNEITICYAPGQFRWMGHTWVVTKVAVIEGDMSDFASKIERLQWEGTKKLVIRHASEKEKPRPMVIGAGARIAIEWQEKRWVVELWEDKVPQLCQAILKALPLEGLTTNQHGSGGVFHYWPVIPGVPEKAETSGWDSWLKAEAGGWDRRTVVDSQGKSIGPTLVTFYDPRDIRGTNRGDIFFNQVEGLKIVHGEIQHEQGQSSVSMGYTRKVGHIIEGDLDELHEVSKTIDRKGAQILRVTRV